MQNFKVILLICSLLTGLNLPAQENMKRIPAGSYKPFIKGLTEKVAVEAFLLDTVQVTNQDFLEFVKANEQWSPDKIKALFADSAYLIHWPENDWQNESKTANQEPVVNVSWFAANAYCKWKKKRLPSLHEWEFAALALPMNSLDSNELTQINHSWYSRKNSTRQPIGSVYENQNGIWDMFGLVWEWVYDFNSVVSSNDSRNKEEIASGFFCGSASLNASDASDYVSFIRYSYRGSLKGNYTTRKLGFRCAKSIEEN